MKFKTNQKRFLEILDNLKKQNYQFSFFKNKDEDKEIYLRHDVDFSLDDAVRIAEVELKKKIFSNFFFLISSSFYNIFNNNDKLKIKKIIKMGHKVGVHFDPSIYNIKEINRCLLREIKIFNNILNIQSNVFSLHRPRNLLNHKFSRNLINTYDKKFIKKIKYISDSSGFFKYDDPISWLDKNNGKSIQLLLHPIWLNKNSTVEQKIFKFYKRKKIDIKKDILENFSSKEVKRKILKGE